MSDTSYPPMPWTLRPAGICLAAAFVVPIDRVRPSIPSSLSIISVLPGRTLGALFVAEYGPGSDLQYNELIVVNAAVRDEGRVVWHVHEILVDSDASYRGGRELLGVPKHLAEFQRSPGFIRISRDDSPYLTWRYGSPWWLFHGRAHLDAVNADVTATDTECETPLRLCGNDIEAVVGHVSSTIDYDNDRLRSVFPSTPLISIAGKSTKAVLGFPIK